MNHDFNLVFETDNEYWKRVLDIFERNEQYPKKRVKGRNLHHKFPKSFSKKLGEEVDNDKDNLISLSLADHFLVHYYYYKLAKKGYRQSMATAFTFMAKKSIKYMSPDTAEMIAKDYEEAVKISEQYKKEMWDDVKRAEQSNKLKSALKEYYKTHDVWNKGKTYSDEYREKISKGVTEYCSKESVRKYRSEQQKGKPHPHKGGFQSEEKGRKISEACKLRTPESRLKTEFGKKFYEHFNLQQIDNKNLYAREYKFYRKFGKCSWE